MRNRNLAYNEASSMIWGVWMKRAMTESAKAEKAKLILDTAYELFKKSTFNDIKMMDIAKAANVSKGTLFNYYSTKEVLFMEMLYIEYGKHLNNLMNLISQYETMSHEDFKHFFLSWMESILDPDSVLIRLNAIKNTILEKNIDYETAIKDKVDMYAFLEKIGEMLAERVEYLTAEASIDLLMAQNAMIVGYVNMASVPDVIRKAIDDNELEGFKVDFNKSALAAMEYYLDGLYVKKKGEV
ncbi:TetR family transcriptional regulator [Paenibacillus durus]|nr:TetR family transcriptional regulator [Paenibacillus durus]